MPLTHKDKTSSFGWMRVNRIDLRALTFMFMRPTGTNLVLDPIAVLRLDKPQYILKTYNHLTNLQTIVMVFSLPSN